MLFPWRCLGFGLWCVQRREGDVRLLGVDEVLNFAKKDGREGVWGLEGENALGKVDAGVFNAAKFGNLGFDFGGTMGAA